VDRFHVGPELDRVRLSNLKDGRSISFEDASAERGQWFCVTTWTEKPESDFFCVEPWSALPNAVANGFGLQTTPPGGVAEISCRLRAGNGG
ncbi:MAG: aldose epimerase, partial [Verrucomicrobiota bacterium]